MTIHIAFAALVSLILSVWSAPLLAQPLTDHKVEAQFGDWQVVCKPPIDGAQPQRICGLVQNVMAEDRGNVGLVIQFQDYGGAARAIRIFAPLGVLLPQGLRIKLDDRDVCFAGVKGIADCMPFPFLRCTPDACIAQVAIGDELLARLKSAKTAVFIVYQTEEAGIGIPISMTGFAKGLAMVSGK